MFLPFSHTCFAFSSYWKMCTVALPCHHGRVLLVPLIAPSCCSVSLTTSMESSSYHVLFCNTLGWSEGSLSPQDCCAAWPYSVPMQCNTHPAFLAEVGVPAGEGGPWCCLGQLPSPAWEEALLGKSQRCFLCKLRVWRSGRQWVNTVEEQSMGEDLLSQPYKVVLQLRS